MKDNEIEGLKYKQIELASQNKVIENAEIFIDGLTSATETAGQASAERGGIRDVDDNVEREHWHSVNAFLEWA